MHGEAASGETPVEASKEGSRFRFVIQVDNLKRSEWGLLFTALGHHPDHPFKLKIGGAKPVCFGSIDIQIDEIQVQEQARDRYLDWNVQSESTRTVSNWRYGSANVPIKRQILSSSRIY